VAITNTKKTAPSKLIIATLLTSYADSLDHPTCLHKQIQRQRETRAVRQESIYDKISGCVVVFEPAVRRLHAARGGIRRQELDTSELRRELGPYERAGRFTEGFDTADLKDAKTLLDELNW